MKQINFADIAQTPNALDRHAKLDAELQRVGDDFMLTDCLLWREKGGSYVLSVLDKLSIERAQAGQVMTFQLRVLCDEWGEPVEPGRELEWLFAHRTRDHRGAKILRRDVNAAKRRGEERMYEIWHSATVDDDGCITVSYQDAALLLDKHGVHYDSGEPITGLREFATDPRYFNARNGRPIKTDAERRKIVEHGGEVIEKLRHNWLYAEVPPAADPPVRKKRKGKAKANPAGGEE